MGTWQASFFREIFSASRRGGSAAKVFGVTLQVIISSRRSSGLAYGVGQANWTVLQSLLKPALAFTVFPLANAFAFHGITLLIGFLSGPAAVAVFNSYRTLARISTQITGILAHALWAEFSRLYGAGEVSALATFYKRSFWGGAIVSCGAAMCLVIAGPTLLAIWTQGSIPFYPTLFLILMGYAAVAAIWHVPRMLLMAINRHAGVAAWSLLAALLSIVLAYQLGLHYSLVGVAVAVLCAEVVICLASVRQAQCLIAHLN